MKKVKVENVNVIVKRKTVNQISNLHLSMAVNDEPEPTYFRNSNDIRSEEKSCLNKNECRTSFKPVKVHRLRNR